MHALDTKTLRKVFKLMKEFGVSILDIDIDTDTRVHIYMPVLSPKKCG